jgi:hypothetical protein
MWPDKRGSVGKHLRRLLASGDYARLEPERFASGSVAVQGFSALERFLFSGDITTDSFGKSEQGRYRCAVLATITGNLCRMAAEVVEEWTAGEEPFRDFIATAAKGNAYYYSDLEVNSTLLNSLHTELRLIVEYKLIRPARAVAQIGSWQASRVVAQ